MDKRVYAVWLSLVLGTKNNAAAALFARFCDAESIYRCDSYDDVDELRPNVRKALADKDLSRAESICAECDKKQIGILSYSDSLFPSRLKTISNPPCLLYYKGKPIQLDDECVIGMVGTRAMTDYGRDVTYAFASSFARSGAIVVSGLAAGVDAVAHMGALDVGGYTVAVLGTPIDKIYPKENAAIYERIEAHGAIYSEYYPGCKTTAACFPIRNRLIAGLSTALVVSEAGEHSGALITAHNAVMQGKPVFAIPGKAGGVSTAGTNDMLRKGARMAARPYDVLSLFEFVYPDKIKINRDSYILGEAEIPTAAYVTNTLPKKATAAKAERDKDEASPEKKKKPAVSQTLDYLTATEQKVFDAIDPELGSTADAVAASAGIPIVDVLSTLTILEIYGLVKPVAGGSYLRV